jgi:hypothetical protein
VVAVGDFNEYHLGAVLVELFGQEYLIRVLAA